MNGGGGDSMGCCWTPKNAAMAACGWCEAAARRREGLPAAAQSLVAPPDAGGEEDGAAGGCSWVVAGCSMVRELGMVHERERGKGIWVLSLRKWSDGS